MSDTPRTDAFLRAENCTRDNPAAFDWLVGFARSLEREVANAYKGYQACNDDLIKCDEDVMRWFKAASPYATPGSLAEGLKKLRADVIEECADLADQKLDHYSGTECTYRGDVAEAIRALKTP